MTSLVESVGAAAPQPAAWRQFPAVVGYGPTIAGLVNAALALGLLLTLAAWADSIPLLPRGDTPAGLYVTFAVAMGIAVLVVNGAAHGEAYFATLWATMPFLPMAASIAVVVSYLATPPETALHGEALLFGLVLAAGGWVVSGGPLRGLASADIAQPRSFEDLRHRTKALGDLVAERLGILPAEGATTHLGVGSNADARRELLGQLAILETELGLTGSPPPGAGIRYVSATGYICLWRTLHRAEQLLIDIEDDNQVFAAAVYDDLRLAGSGIPNADALRKLLRSAVAALESQSAAAHLPAAVSTAEAPPPQPGGGPLSDAKTAEPPAGDYPAVLDKIKARRVIREVRRSVNEYRDGLWEGLIRQRNRLLRTVVVTATAALLVVGLAITMKAGTAGVAAGAAYFLVGAAVGLFVRLWTEGEARSAVDDYGLFEARLMQTPILSGMAGVAGVCLMALLPAVAGAEAATSFTLASVFDLSANAQPLVTAAVFGMAPELLIKSLRSRVKGTSDSLTASQAAGSSAASGNSTSNGSQTETRP